MNADYFFGASSLVDLASFAALSFAAFSSLASLSLVALPSLAALSFAAFSSFAGLLFLRGLVLRGLLFRRCHGLCGLFVLGGGRLLVVLCRGRLLVVLHGLRLGCGRGCRGGLRRFGFRGGCRRSRCGRRGWSGLGRFGLRGRDGGSRRGSGSLGGSGSRRRRSRSHSGSSGRCSRRRRRRRGLRRGRRRRRDRCGGGCRSLCGCRHRWCGRCAAHRDLPLELGELALLDPLDLHDVLGGLERPIGRPVIDDRLCLHGADTRQNVELVLGRGVDVDGGPRQAREQQGDDQQQKPFHQGAP